MVYPFHVWGGFSDTKIDEIFIIQKHCIRIKFGDYKAYIDKFCTCARTRLYQKKGKRNLGQDFFCREHTKPLFNGNELLTVKNLYHYFCAVELFKILKFRLPINLYEIYDESNRDESLIILTPQPKIRFRYASSKLWNDIHEKVLCEPELHLTKVSHFKKDLKALLFIRQKIGDATEWQPANFSVK